MKTAFIYVQLMALLALPTWAATPSSTPSPTPSSTPKTATAKTAVVAEASSLENRLLFDKPAANYQSAMPLGNGTLLANALGGTLQDKIQLSESSLWAATQTQLNATDATANYQMPYRPMAEIWLQFAGHGSVKSYSREFDLKTAVSTVKYTVGGVVFTREYLTSFTDSVAIIHLKASKPGSISLTMRVNAVLPKSNVVGMGDMLQLGGSLQSIKNKQVVQFQTQIKPLLKNGRAVLKNGIFTITKADEVTLYVSSSTNLSDMLEPTVEVDEKCSRILNRAFGRDFNSMKQRHLVGYRAAFDQAILHLADQATAVQNYQFGRYLQRVLSTSYRLPDANRGLSTLWLQSQQIVDQYLQTGNAAVLKERYPQMKQAARQAFASVLTGEVADLKQGLVLGELYSNVLLVGDALSNGLKNLFANSDKVFLDSVRVARSKLPVLVADKEGNLNFSEASTAASPSYGPILAGLATGDTRIAALNAVFPGSRISPLKSPDLAQAARKTLLQASAVGISGGAAVEAIRWARLFDGNQALQQLQKGWRAFDSQNASQLENSIGQVRCFNELLLQTTQDALFVLPALPDAWKNGTIKGLIAPGGFVVDISWSKGVLELLTIKATLDGNCRIRSRSTLNGKNLKPAKNANPNPLFRSLDLSVEPPVGGGFQLYDLKMIAGETVTLTH